MKDINFLPPRYHEATAQRQSQAWRMVVLIAFGGLICAAVLGQYSIRCKAEAELAIIREQYNTTQVHSQRLATFEQSLAARRASAELLAFLGHPWPRTQILANLFESLPDTIVLRRVHILREVAPVAAGSLGTNPSAAPAGSAAAATKTISPAQNDWQRLREETEATQIVVLIDGTADDDTSLHVYLGTLAACGLFAKAELASLESTDRNKDGGDHQFTARIVVRPGYGQRNGPKGPPESDSQKIDLQAALAPVQQEIQP